MGAASPSQSRIQNPLRSVFPPFLWILILIKTSHRPLSLHFSRSPYIYTPLCAGSRSPIQIHRSSVRHCSRMDTAKASSPSSASSKRWKRAETVRAFPSSKRIQSAPYPSQSNAAASVWVRVSEKPANSSTFNCEDLQVSATAKRKIITDDVPDLPSYQMEIDADLDAKVVDVSHKFALRASSCTVKERPEEADPHKLGQRQKQIDYGKNTLGYERYLELVPMGRRRKQHPVTPDIKQVCSKRSWDGQVKKWRRRLHEFDPPVSDDDVSPQMFSVGIKKGETEQDRSEEQDQSEDDPASDPKSGSECGASGIYEDWYEMEP